MGGVPIMPNRSRSVLFSALALLAGIALSARPVRAADRNKWVEVRSPNFIVVSDGSEADARKVAQQFEQVRALFRESLVYARSHPSPVITILAAKDENSLRELLPEYWETKGHTHPAGIFLDAYDQFQVAIALDAHGDNPYETIYHEYYHSVTTPYFSALPLWVTEGMADFYGNTEIYDKNASMGMPNVGLIELLRNQALLPLSTLFAVTHDSPYYNEQTKATIFYAESWALIHYLMIGDQLAHRTEFSNFLSALDKGASTQQAAAAFGDLGKMQADLERYVRSFSFSALSIAAPAKIAPKDLQVRALSDAESDAYRGGFLALHGQFKNAQPLLEEAARLDPKLALAQQNLGVLHFIQPMQADQARAAFSAAIALDPNNAYTRYLRAKVNFDAGDSASASEAQADLRQAIAVNPDFAPPYGLLALYLVAREDTLPEALTLAQKGASLEPGRTEYQFDLAQVLMRMRRYDDAEATARHLLLQVSDPSQQKEVNSLLNSVQQSRQFDAQSAQRQQELAAALAARNSAAASSESEKSERPDEGIVRSESTPTNVQPPPPDKRIRGVATEVVCRGNDMRVTVKNADTSVVLHVSDAGKVDYTSYVLVRPGIISPCDDLKGRTVRVTTKDGTPNSEITALDIMK
jgi:tetratricopeptide (TPR) repeat protein